MLHRETTFTALLGNLLRRSETFRREFYKFMKRETLPDGPLEIINELSTENGRYDLVFNFLEPSMKVYFEIKVEEDCRLTDYQVKEGHGAYWLVPGNWRYAEQLRLLRPLGTQTVEDLAVELSEKGFRNKDPILTEFLNYLELAFPTIRFEENERSTMFNDVRAFAGAAVKLHSIVDSIAERLNKSKLIRTRLGKNERYEYGYYIHSRINGDPILWVGIWPSENCLICLGYERKWRNGRDYPGFRLGADSKWMIRDMSEHFRTNADAVQEVYKEVMGVLDK